KRCAAASTVVGPDCSNCSSKRPKRWGESMSRILHIVAGFLIAVLVTLPPRAAVIDSAANGFSVVEKTHISASPDKIYAALVAPARWWSSKHTFSQDAANLSLDPVAG